MKTPQTSTLPHPVPSPIETIRYRIETKQPGTIIESHLIRKVVSTRGEKAIVIVYVAFADKKEFEKYIEGHALVLGYSAEAQVAGTDPKDWTKP